MNATRRDRRGFLKEGAALTGLALGAARSASGQTPGHETGHEAASKDPKELITAYLLCKNGVIQEDAVMDAQSLPKVAMPNRQGAAMPAQEWKHGAPRLLRYP